MANIEPTHESVPSESSQPDAAARLGRVAVALGAVLATSVTKSDYDELKTKLRSLATRDPIDSLLGTVLGGGMLFYLLERGRNPRCNTYWDAVLYVATSLSVGYDDVFPKTTAGNAVAALVQSFGPSLAANAFAKPAAAEPTAPARDDELLAVNRSILARLEEIAGLLKAQDPRP